MSGGVTPAVATSPHGHILGTRETADRVHVRKDAAFGGMCMMPDELPGIDVRRALEGLRGNASLLLKIIEAFRKETSGIVERLTAARGRDDLQQARHDAHNLKGLALTLGATHLASIAGRLERQIGDAEPDIAGDTYSEIESELARVGESAARLQRIIEESIQKAAAADGVIVEPDLNLAKSLLPSLLQLLSRNSLDARHVFRTLRTHLGGGEYQADVDAIGAAIASLDFRAAEKAVAGLAARLGLSATASLSSTLDEIRLPMKGEGAP